MDGGNTKKNIKMLPTAVKKVPGAVQIATFMNASFVVNNKGQVFAFGNNFKGLLGLEENAKDDVPTQVPNLKDIVKMSMGTFHALALDSKGQAWSAGSNQHGALGRDNKETPYNRFGKVNQ